MGNPFTVRQSTVRGGDALRDTASGGAATFDAAVTCSLTVAGALTTAIPLTGKTVTLRFSINKGPTVERTMTAMDQSIRPGWAQYQFTSTDLNASGEMKGEVRINAGQSDQLTTDRLFTEKVREPLP